jgi:hypothetical protein
MTNDITIASVTNDPRSVATLQDINEGEWVEYSDGQYGIVVGVVDGPVEWPTGDDATEDVGDDGDNVYIVARESGGSKPFTLDEIESADRETVIGDDDDVPDNPEEDLDEAEMAPAYKMVPESQVAELHSTGVSELINVPGVDDPGVGFDDWPDSWEESEKPERLIALDAWSSMGGTFTGCVSEIGSRRLCAAFKDEMLGTERWRGRF